MVIAVLFILSLTANADPAPFALVDAPGKAQVAAYCQICHSLDYIGMNARFLGERGWNAEIKKMISAYGAPIPPADADLIVKYLVTNY